MARHAESTYNVAGLVNGDCSVRVALSSHGVEQARALAAELAGVEVGVYMHTRFVRTLETAHLALGDADIQTTFVCEPLLDDIRCGSMEGWPVSDDHAWRAARNRDRRPQGGESIRDAAQRIASGLRSIASRPEPIVAVVTHELIVRYALNAAHGSTDLAEPWRDIPHAMPFRINHETIVRAAERIDRLASGAWGCAVPGALANGG